MRNRRNPRNRRGVETIELILVLPILVIVLIFSVQFAIVAIYQSTVVHAATVAAREAGKDQGADELGAGIRTDFDKVVASVEYIAGVNCIQISDASSSGTKVVLEDLNPPNPLEAPSVAYGDPALDCQPPLTPAVEPGQVRVTVCVDLMKATRFCDALAPWGVTFAGRVFRASSLVMKEYEQDLSVGGLP